MDYPNGYDIPVAPRARKLALSRGLAIWSCIAFLVIIALCIFTVWSMHSTRLRPYLISIDADAGEWAVVSENKKSAESYPAWYTMQESVAVNFSKAWLNISDDATENDLNWCRCDKAKCDDDIKTCRVCCESRTELYGKFIQDALPDYQARFGNGEVRQIDEKSIVIKPLPGIGKNGGMWRIYARLQSLTYGNLDIEIYVKIMRSDNSNPLTLGYYVMDFNAFTTSME